MYPLVEISTQSNGWACELVELVEDVWMEDGKKKYVISI